MCIIADLIVRCEKKDVQAYFIRFDSLPWGPPLRRPKAIYRIYSLKIYSTHGYDFAQ